MSADGGRFRKTNISYLVLEAKSSRNPSVQQAEPPALAYRILANSDLRFAKQAQELLEVSDVLCQKEVSQVCKETLSKERSLSGVLPA